jgi:hypothetical protein
MKELIDSYKAQAEALFQEGRIELAARAMSEARRLEKRLQELKEKGEAEHEQ